MEIVNKKKNLSKLQEKHLAFLTDLRKSLSWFDFHHLTLYSYSTNLKALRRVEATQKRKLDKLLQEYLAKGINPEKVIFNYSDYILDRIEKTVFFPRFKI